MSKKILLCFIITAGIILNISCGAPSAEDTGEPANIEETDESLFWMEILWESGIVKQNLLESLYNEGEELLKIMTTSRKNSQKH